MTEEIVKEYDSKKVQLEKQIKAAAAYKEKMVNEAKEQVDRWNKTGLLQGYDDDYVMGQMAILFENQRLMNEIVTDSDNIAQFKRISIPMVRRVYDPAYCLIWDLASFQAMIGPTAFAFFNRPDGEVVEETSARTKRLKSVWEFTVHDNIRQHDLDKEAEMTAVLSAELCDEINQEVIADLRNNAGIAEEMDWQGAEALWSYLTGLFYRFETETAPNKEVPFGKKPNWIVTNKLLAAEIRKTVEFEARSDKPSEWHDKLTCIRTGVINKEIKLIECDSMLPNDILVGYKKGPFGAGYVYMPYVPFTRTPVSLDPDSFAPRAGILTRYTKRLSTKGSNFYARLTVKGHIGENVDKSE